MKLTTGWKIVLWTAALLAVWLLFVNPTIFDAIITFCLAGVVPGTNKVLSPNAVITIVGGVLGFIVLLIVGIPIARRLIGRRKLGRERLPRMDEAVLHAKTTHQRLGGVIVGALKKESDQNATHSEATQKTPEAVVVSTPELLPQKNPLFLKFITGTVALKAKLQPIVRKFVPTLREYGRVAGIIVRHESRNSKRFAKRTFAAAQKAAVLAVGWAATQLIAFWTWLKPHVHRFDAWLAKELRPYKKKISKRARKNDTLMLLRDITKGLLREIKPYSPVVLWGKFRDEQQLTKEHSLKDIE